MNDAAAAQSLNVGLLMFKQQKDRQTDRQTDRQMLLPLNAAASAVHPLWVIVTSVTVTLRKSPMVILKLLILLIKANFYYKGMTLIWVQDAHFE